MTYRLPANVTCYLPIHRVATPAKTVQLFSLFRKVGKSYLRIRTQAYPAKAAMLVFGEVYASNPNELSIRPVTIELNEAK